MGELRSALKRGGELERGSKVWLGLCQGPPADLRRLSDDVAGKVDLYFDAKAIAPEALVAAVERHGVVERTVVYGGPPPGEAQSRQSRIRLLPPLESPAALDALARDLKPYAVDARWEILSP